MNKFIFLVLLFIIIKCHNVASRAVYQQVNKPENLLKQLFRLTELPKKTDFKKSRLEKRSAPIYLMDIYKNTVDHTPGFEYNETAMDLTDHDFDKINKSDVIMSFIAQQPYKGRGGKPKFIRRMWFDVTENNNGQQLISAELKFFRDCSRVSKPSNRRAYNVTIYRRIFVNNVRNHVYVNSVIVPENYHGWFSVNVTDCFKFWTDNPADNHGVKVVAMPVGDGRRKRKVRPEHIGIVGFDGEPERFSFLVGYFRDFGKNELLDKVIGEFYHDNFHRISKRAARRSRNNLCKLHKVYVDFRDIGWDEWIVAPPGYDAGDCVGTCRFPMSDNMNGTNLAIIKELYQGVDNNSFSKSHCTAIQYEPLKLLFYSNENTVVYRSYKDMSATACGCR